MEKKKYPVLLDLGKKYQEEGNDAKWYWVHTDRPYTHTQLSFYSLSFLENYFLYYPRTVTYTRGLELPMANLFSHKR